MDADYSLPILFTVDKNGKERLWKVWVQGNVVHRESGLVKGQKVPGQRSFEGKNKGKVNETTPEDQAQLEAEKMWIKQLDKNYRPRCKEGKAMVAKITKTKEKTGGHNINSSAQIRGRKTKNVKRKESLAVSCVQKKVTPMKASHWELIDDTYQPLPKIAKYFDFEEGVYVQWKLDGFRCIAQLQDDDIILTSNSTKQFPWCKTLRESIRQFMGDKNCLDGLDGELYVHHLYDDNGSEFSPDMRFSKIQGICSISRTNPDPLEDQICLYVFDLVDLSGEYDQDERFRLLKKLFRHNKDSRIVRVKTNTVYKPEDIITYHDQYALEGYEGVIIRSRNLKYKQNRSLQLRKHKYFMDEEFTIHGVEKKSGVGDEHFVWVCKTENGEKFRATPGNTVEQRQEWYRSYKKYRGKLLTVKFQGYEEDNPGIPRFPVAKGIRDPADMSHI